LTKLKQLNYKPSLKTKLDRTFRIAVVATTCDVIFTRGSDKKLHFTNKGQYFFENRVTSLVDGSRCKTAKRFKIINCKCKFSWTNKA